MAGLFIRVHMVRANSTAWKFGIDKVFKCLFIWRRLWPPSYKYDFEDIWYFWIQKSWSPKRLSCGIESKCEVVKDDKRIYPHFHNMKTWSPLKFYYSTFIIVLKVKSRQRFLLPCFTSNWHHFSPAQEGVSMDALDAKIIWYFLFSRSSRKAPFDVLTRGLNHIIFSSAGTIICCFSRRWDSCTS